MIYSSDELDDLRKTVSERISKKRFSHVLGVERCARYLGGLLLPDLVDELSAAALLHDISKEFSYEMQLQILSDSDFLTTAEDINTHGVLHSFTAPIIIKKDFPRFATENIISAVTYHTVGRPDMSTFEKIIFISDYCEDTRTYESCINVRKSLVEGLEDLSYEERIVRLDKACLMSIDGALDALTRLEAPINSRMYLTKNSLLRN